MSRTTRRHVPAAWDHRTIPRNGSEIMLIEGLYPSAAHPGEERATEVAVAIVEKLVDAGDREVDGVARLLTVAMAGSPRNSTPRRQAAKPPQHGRESANDQVSLAWLDGSGPGVPSRPSATRPVVSAV